MRTHTDETRVDLKRPRFDDSAASDTIPQATLPDDLEDADDATTTQLSHFPWLEHPRDLGERPRARAIGKAVPTGLSRSVGALSRSVGALSRSVGAPPHSHRAPYWRALGVVAIVAASIPIFVGRAQRTSTAVHDASGVAQDATLRPSPPPPAAPAAQPATATPLPPLMITVGTPNVAPAVAPRPTKPPISVSRLPVAPPASVSSPPAKRANRPVFRTSSPLAPASPAVRTTTGTPGSTPVIDDGF